MKARTWKTPEIVARKPLPLEAMRTTILAEEALELLEEAVRAPAPLAMAPTFDRERLRSLREEEIRALGERGCFCEDWSRIRVHAGFRPERLSSVRLVGEVLLGLLEGEVVLPSGVRLPSGIHDATVADCTVGDRAHIGHVGVLANHLIGAGATIWHCDEVVAPGECHYGNGVEIAVGVETGGREVLAWAELTVPIAECVAKRRDLAEFQERYAALVAQYAAAVGGTRGVIGDGALVSGCGLVHGCFLGAAARVERAARLTNATVLSTSEEPSRVADGAIVEDSILQWGCSAESMAIVTRSVLIEHSHVERHGKVADTILGPNSGIAEGEATASLIGPFVAFHHQALLIAAIWPEGRGNIAYGANVGSNHTSRAPDQEIWPGEGVFFGLGCDVKYPTNLSDAPYSLIASGVTMLPQRLSMPFSLINPPARSVERLSPSYNEVMPAWMLHSNYYAVARSEAKFRQRDRARRTVFDFTVLRPEIVRLMVRARDELAGVARERAYYTDADIAGLGKNYLSEPSRIAAIAAYGRHIRLYGLRTLLEWAEASLVAEECLTEERWRLGDTSPEHELAVEVLDSEAPGVALAEALALLAVEESALAAEALQSKERDDYRGAVTIPDFGSAHTAAAHDPVILALQGHAESVARRIGQVLGAP